MKTLDLTGSNQPSLPEILELAQKESLILRTASGKEYFIGIVDDFQHELDQLSESTEFQQLLHDRQKERGAIPIEAIRDRLS
jgi:DNA-binding PucR family transcriptional regulator